MIEIPLTRNQIALIDDEDFALVSRYSWYASWSKTSSSFYARAKNRLPTGTWETIHMHRLITKAPKGLFVDHINHETLDNRRLNIRLCNKSENAMNAGAHQDNRSGLKGVSLFKPRGLWRARISFDKKDRTIGYFKTKEQAYEAYCKAAAELHGEFANFG